MSAEVLFQGHGFRPFASDLLGLVHSWDLHWRIKLNFSESICTYFSGKGTRFQDFIHHHRPVLSDLTIRSTANTYNYFARQEPNTMCSPMTPLSRKVAQATSAAAPIGEQVVLPQAPPQSKNTINRRTEPLESFSPPPANNLRIRYLSRLGITQEPQRKKIVPLKLSRRPKSNLVTLQAPPKKDEESKEVDRDDSPSCNKVRSVSFDDSITIRSIPTRKEYPVAIRKDLWGTKEEVLFNVHRNAMEFAAEGWDWQQAVEDHEMIKGHNGELIHPVHIRRFTVQQQFLARRAAAY